jgi:hypothetical protein
VDFGIFASRVMLMLRLYFKRVVLVQLWCLFGGTSLSVPLQ